MTIVLVFSFILVMRYFCSSVLPEPVNPPITIETFESIKTSNKSTTSLGKNCSFSSIRSLLEAIRIEKQTHSTLFLRQML